MSDDSQGFGAGLRACRRAARLSQEELAERSGLTARAISNLERGRARWPYRETVRRLADALELRDTARAEFMIAAGRRLAASPGTDGAGSAREESHGPHSDLLVSRQLPATVRHFTGRAAELAELNRLVEESRNGDGAGTGVIMAISGTAGVGKTALAVSWAHRVSDRFPDGQLFLDLRGYASDQPMPADDALGFLLDALGIPCHDVPPGTHARAARYKTLLAGKRMLILLDNASRAEQVRPLLPGSPTCVTLVTSRDSLAGLVARDGAQRLDLDLLSPAEADELLRALIGARVDTSPEAAAKLATQCCWLPLALRVAAELATARPSAPLGDLTDELADQQQRLDYFAAGGDVTTAVRAVFSWSYRHLSAELCRIFRLIGLHPGPDLEPYAAAALTGLPLERARNALDVLARAHLIQPTRHGRHGMHDLLRAYARELTCTEDSKDERHAALTRLFDHYLHTAIAAMNALVPAENHHHPATPAQTRPTLLVNSGAAAAREWLEAEKASLVSVAAHTALHGWPDHATRLAATLYRYLDAAGLTPEAISIHTHALRAAQNAGDRNAEAEALTSLGVVSMQQGRCQQAASRFRQSLTLYLASDNKTGQARVLGRLGLIAYQHGRWQQATGYHQQALALFRETGHCAGETYTLTNLAAVELRQSRCRQATELLRQALALAGETGHRFGEAYALGNLAAVELRQGHYQQATHHLSQALAHARETGHRTGETQALIKLAAVELRRGYYRQATEHLRRALAHAEETGHRASEAEALNCLGEVFLATARPGDARTHYAAALASASQIGDKYERARSYHGLARAHQATGDSDQARYHWQEALVLYTSLGAPEADQIRAQFTAEEAEIGR